MRGLLTALLALLIAGAAYGQDCGRPGDQPGRFGPFDYRDPTKDSERYIVEVNHFTNYMEEMAIYGFSSRRAESQAEAEGFSLVGGNLDYTLYAFPNHAKALYAMGIWQLRLRNQSKGEFERLASGARVRSAECYFERAIMFTPNDGLVYAAYGAFLHKQGSLQKAVAQYQRAIELMPDSPEPHYNLGLLYVDLRDYAKASEQASIAYGIGYPLQGLRNKLARVQPNAPATPRDTAQ
jgi:tetratricopeptide (TPR) repeat protein